MQKDPFVEIVRLEFDRKRSRNARYSLRSFSRDLGLDASNLSKILGYSKPLGEKLRKKIAIKLGFESSDLALFGGAEMARTGDKDYAVHSLNTFRVISGWQHYAILEMFKIKGFNLSVSEIASRLGLTDKAAGESLERLKTVGLLKTDLKNRRLEPVDESSSSIFEVSTSKAHRDQQREILEGAIEALNDVPLEERSQSSMTMAIDPKHLDQARGLIKKFRRQMGRLLSDSENLTEVYQLSVSLYPVTKKQIKKKEKQKEKNI